MALTVEDGTKVAGADSYVSRADYITYAATLGVTVADDATADATLRKAAEFIDSHEGRLKGSRATRDQPMSFPRTGLVIEGFDWADTEIPRQVTLCQMQLALDIEAGIDIWNPPQSKSTGIKRQKIEGAVEVEYAIGESTKLSRQSTSRALLSSLLKASGLRLIKG